MIQGILNRFLQFASSRWIQRVNPGPGLKFSSTTSYFWQGITAPTAAGGILHALLLSRLTW